MGYQRVKQWNPPNTYRVEDYDTRRIIRHGLTHREAGRLVKMLHTCEKCGVHFDECPCLESPYPDERQTVAQFDAAR